MSDNNITDFDFASFVDGYIECILWCDCIPTEAMTDPESNWSSGDCEGLNVTESTRGEIIERGQLHEFVADNLADLLLYCEVREYDPSQGTIESYAGHDMYLSRAGHGAGFFDRGLGALGDRLQEAARSMGSPDDHMLFDCGDGTASL